MKYAIYRNEDATEWGLQEADAPPINDGLDVDDRPMKRVKVFEASSWEEAKVEYVRFLSEEGRQVS